MRPAGAVIPLTYHPFPRSRSLPWGPAACRLQVSSPVAVVAQSLHLPAGGAGRA
jgi:hypothetical protein